MNRKNVLFLLLAIMMGTAIAPANARIKAAGNSLLAGNGFVLLHPYFNEKPWKAACENVEILSFPDTFSAPQPLRPLSFDIGKNIESTVAVFTTAQGGLFLMPVDFTPYIGLCLYGGFEFGNPQKIPTPGIAISGGTPIYLVKDSLSSGDSIRIVVGTSPQYLCCLVVKVSAALIVKIDTLQMQSAGSIVRIAGDYSASGQRDTALWAVGANGTIRSFSIGENAWGSEKKWDIGGLSDTVKCINGTYAGTNKGKIYKKSASQTFVLENAGSGKAINAIYPQGAIGNQGNFIEYAGTSWRQETLGTSDYAYANFIRGPGGFDVELLDSKWNYASYTYRDSASKILLTLPGDRYSYVNNGVCKYPLSSPDTGLTIYVLDPDSNYSDFAMSLHGAATTPLNTDGVNVLSAIPDTETCHVGIVRLSDGIINVRLQNDSIKIQTNTELGMQKSDCGTCYWKKFNFIIHKRWNDGDTLFIKASKDILKILNQYLPTWTSSSRKIDPGNAGNIWLRSVGDRSMLHVSVPNLKSVSLFDISGRRIYSLAVFGKSTVTLPRSARGILFIDLVFNDGTSSRMALPIAH